MTEDRIVKFCARAGARSISFVMTNYPQVGVVKATRRFIFWQIGLSVNISKAVQDRGTPTIED